MHNLLEVYVDTADEHRWTLYAAENGTKIGASSEGYKNEEDALNNFLRVGSASATDFHLQKVEIKDGEHRIISQERWAGVLPGQR